MRVHFFQWIQSTQSGGELSVVDGASVYVYLAGTTTQATIYSSETGSAVSQPLTTSSSGYYEFWIDDGDYDLSSQKFKIVASKTGYDSITVDNIDFSTEEGNAPSFRSLTLSYSEPYLYLAGTEVTGPPVLDGHGTPASPYTTTPNQKFRCIEESGVVKFQVNLSLDSEENWFNIWSYSLWDRTFKFIGKDKYEMAAKLAGVLGGLISSANVIGLSVSPGFSAHKNGVNQSANSDEWTKITWSTEDYDTNNNFANSTFTPTIAGKYLLVAGCMIDAMGLGKWMTIAIYKNGVLHRSGTIHYASTAGTNLNAEVSFMIEANGTGDYFEAYAYHNHGSARDIDGLTATTRFQGSWLAP